MDLLPSYGSKKFKCPHCEVVSQQIWFGQNVASAAANEILSDAYYSYRGGIQSYEQEAIEAFIKVVTKANKNAINRFVPSDFSVATCHTCNDISLWVNSEIVYPRKISIDPPNQDMNDEIKSLYHEASTIFIDSPRGSTALLRLVLQMLLIQIGNKGKNINADIKKLVADGVSPTMQKALDVLRVVGNNSVHPGQIDLEDNADVALKLFGIINYIADEMITNPKELKLLYSDIIPEETKEHINQRDGRVSDKV